MYCSKCGKQIPDDSVFCSGCGTAIGGNDSNPDYAREEGRKAKLMSSLCQALDYFKQNSSGYDRFFSLVDRASRMQVRYPKYGIILPIIFGIFAWLLLIPQLLMLLMGNKSNWSAALPSAVIAIVIAVFGVILPIYLARKRKRRLADEKQELSNQISQAYQQLIDYYNAYPDCPVSFDYSCPTQINSIIGLIVDRRADTLKEAINTLEEDIHKERIEIAQHQLLSRI